jgi:predicted transcriptional regulator
MMPHPYPNFAQALRELAATDAQRAALLGVSRRMVLSYKRGDSLPSVDKVKRHAALDDALTRDIRPSGVAQAC